MRNLPISPLFCMALVASLQAEPVSIEALPPVVKTVPASESDTGDPSTNEI